MFGTNQLCMKGIYLPTFQRSIILRVNEGLRAHQTRRLGRQSRLLKFTDLKSLQLCQKWNFSRPVILRRRL